MLILLTVGITAAFLAGIRPFANMTPTDGSDRTFPTRATMSSNGGGGDGSDTGGNDTGSNDSDGDGDSGDGDATETQSRPPSGAVIADIEECGQTCRDVTNTITGQRDTDNSGVTLCSRVFVGNDVDPGDEAWRGT